MIPNERITILHRAWFRFCFDNAVIAVGFYWTAHIERVVFSDLCKNSNLTILQFRKF